MAKILIVEDEEITAFSLEMFCQSFGYTTLESVNNYDDAIASIRQNHPDLLICDIELHGPKNGLDIASIAQKQYAIPTLFLTAYYNEEIHNRAKDLDFYGYILKPYQEKELEATLKLAFHHITQNQPYTQRYIDIRQYVFDMKTRTLYNETEVLPLSKKSRRLLYRLLLSPNETRPYRDIIDYVYEGEAASLDTLRHLVRRTRSVFDYDAIKSIRNIGYVFLL